jgi:hypothetical protein
MTEQPAIISAVTRLRILHLLSSCLPAARWAASVAAAISVRKLPE